MTNRKFAVIAILIIALLLRLLGLSLYQLVPQLQRLVLGGDAVGYTQLAKNILSTGSFSFDPGHATAFRMPGYPLFLVVTYAVWQTPLPTQVIQIGIDLLTVWLVYEIGYTLSPDDDRIPLFAATAVALNPLLIVSAYTLYPETIAIFLVSLGTLLFLRFPDSIYAGIIASLVLGISLYFKPTLIALVITLLLLFSVRQLSIRRFTTVAVATFLTSFTVIIILLAPWIVRNLLVMHAFIPLTTSSGVNLYGGNNPNSNGGYVYSGPYVLPNRSESESDREYTRRAMDWIMSNPVNFLKLLPYKAARFLWPLSLGTSGYIVVPKIIFALVMGVTLVFYGLAVYGMGVLVVTKRFWEVVILVTPFICLLLTSLLAFGAVRFSLPAFPNLAILASLGFERIIVNFKYRSERKHP